MIRAGCAAVLLAAAATPAHAQQQGFRVTEPLDPPLAEDARTLRAQARIRGIETEVTYAGAIEGDLADGPAIELRPQGTVRPAEPPLPGSVPTIAVLAALAVGLLLWLRFGGAGALLAPAPRPDRPRPAAPAGWAVEPGDGTADPQTLLAQIAAMPDRRAALVRLLHHCLLAAGQDSDTRFARADTERDAFRRLPSGWRHRTALGRLLRATELAHYGGRAVADADFAAALDTGRRVLMREGPADA
ncbi:hypothetical protein [Paracoccus aminovorans]|uniref:hypothetical protein n=1 Tax=Paracoccus aminovorans TaxID=34004 RepID=UPI002B25A567|nr:hypothetical protein [Paracoccus aminovorans]